MADTPNLIIPLIAANQNQKHVTHNEALRDLDAIVQLAVIDRNLTAPPGAPSDGDRYIVAAGGTGAWAGKDLNVAAWQDGAWAFHVPRNGWICWIVDEAALVVWTGAAWDAFTAATGFVSLAGANAFTGANSFIDANLSILDDVDATKIAKFQLSGITTATTRTYTLPNVDGTLASLGNAAQTFQGSITFSNATLSFGTSTAASTVNIGTGATLAATTKTINIGTGGVSTSVTNINIGSATGGALGTYTVNSVTFTFNGTAIGATNANMTVKWVGIGGATADVTNRLSANTPSVLFNHAGSDINTTLNKAAAGDDARFTFQTGFSTRSLFGLLGDDNFSIKVSPDGAAFSDALVVDKTTALMTGRKAGAVPAVQAAVLTANLAGADVATAQAWFTAATDTLTVEALTTYFIEGELSISRAAGTTSHTFGILFGGTATLTSMGYMAQVTNPTGNVLASVNQIWCSSSGLLTLTTANIVATENINIMIKGTMRVNAAGTIIPQFQYSAAPGGAPTIRQNTAFRLYPIGANTVASVGSAWS